MAVEAMEREVMDVVALYVVVVVVQLLILEEV